MCVVMIAVFVKMNPARAFVGAMNVAVVAREVDIKFYASDGRFLLPANVEMITVQLQFLQLAFEFARIHAEIQQRGDEHIAGDAAEKVEVKNFHGREASAFIWLAA